PPSSASAARTRRSRSTGRCSRRRNCGLQLTTPSTVWAPLLGEEGKSFLSPPFQGGVARSDGVVNAQRVLGDVSIKHLFLRYLRASFFPASDFPQAAVSKCCLFPTTHR